MDLTDYKNQVKNLSINEQKLRDLYLRDIALGKIQGPMTGYASLDKPWLKFYKEEFIKSEIPHMCAFEYFEQMNKSNMDKLAIDCSIQGKFTYAEFTAEYYKLAKAMYAVGIRKGDKSLFVLPPMALESMLFYASNLVGAAISGLPEYTPTQEICNAINELGIDNLFIFDSVFSEMREKELYEKTNLKNIIYYGKNKKYYCNQTISYVDFLQRGKNVELPQIARTPEDLLFIARTGGSTGKPKSVMLNSNSFNIAVHEYLNSDLLYRRGDHWLRLWALFSATAAVSNSHLPLSSGMVNIIRPFPMNIFEFDKIVDDVKPNHLMLIPQLLDILEQSELLKDQNLDYIKTVGCGGIAINNEFEYKVDRFLKSHNINTYLGYGWGCTENATSAAMRSSYETTKIGCVGVPLVKTIVSVFDLNTRQELPYGEVGELCINSPTYMAGYYNDSVLTNEVLKRHEDGSVWLHTGDLGVMDKDGFVTVKGRMTKTIFVFPTAKIYYNDLEEIISKANGVLQIVISQIPDEEHQNFAYPICFIVPKPGYSFEKVRKNVEKICSISLSEYARPKLICIKEEIPLLPSGKPNEDLLKQELMKGISFTKRLK